MEKYFVIVPTDNDYEYTSDTGRTKRIDPFLGIIVSEEILTILTNPQYNLHDSEILQKLMYLNPTIIQQTINDIAWYPFRIENFKDIKEYHVTIII